MNALQDLYQSVILDHNKNPRNFKVLDSCTHQASGYNPVCGDSMVLYLVVDNGMISDVSFKGVGCAISVASASLMTEVLKGMSLNDARTLFENMHNNLTKDNWNELGKLDVLSGVKAFPARVKCASLSWHTLMAALSEDKNVACTE